MMKNMIKVIAWILGTSLFIGIASVFLSDPASNTQFQEKKPATPTEIKRQRVAADKVAEADFQRMDKLDANSFCARELTKLRSTNLSAAQTEALELQAMRFLVSADQIQRVKKKNVAIGDSSCTAIASWGRPQKINTSQGATYSNEQWVYGNGHYLYITDNIVTNMQTSQ